MSLLACRLSPKDQEALGRAVQESYTVAEDIFSEVNWQKLRAQRQVLSGWSILRPDGALEKAEIEIAYVYSQKDVQRWCTSLLEKMFKVKHPAYGCTKSQKPWRVLIDASPKRFGEPTIDQILAHELWHLKGYWDHVPDGSWPAHSKSKRPAPYTRPGPYDYARSS